MHYELGQTLRQSGDLAGAVAAFEKALEIDPELREGYYALGQALKQQGAPRARRVLPLTSPADDLFTRAQEAAGRGELDAAREQLTEALRLDERHAEAHNLLGFILGQQGDLPAAVGAPRARGRASSPSPPTARYNLGVALWYSGVREQAVARAAGERRGSIRRPAPATRFSARRCASSGDLAGGAREPAARDCAAAADRCGLRRLGITYLRAGDLDKALGQFEAGLNLPAPALPAPDWDGATAAACARRCGRQPGDAPRRTTCSGWLLGRRGAGSAEVAAAFREAIRLRPDFAEAHNNLGLVLLQAGDDQAGIAALREAVRIAPDYADARANLGAALTPDRRGGGDPRAREGGGAGAGGREGAVQPGDAYGASPSHGSRQGDRAAAQGDRARTRRSRARTSRSARRCSRAARCPTRSPRCRKRRGSSPTSGEAHYQLGLALSRAGRKDEAAAELKKGRELVAADDRASERASSTSPKAARRSSEAIWRRPPPGSATPSAAARLRGGTAPPGNDHWRSCGRRSSASAHRRRRSRRSDVSRQAELEGYIREGKFAEVEPLLAAVREGAAAVVVGLVRARLQPVRPAEDRRVDSRRSRSRCELDVRNAEAHKILGRNLMIIGRFDAAQVEFEQGIRYKPDSAELHYNLGKLFSIQDNWEPARKAFEAAAAARSRRTSKRSTRSASRSRRWATMTARWRAYREGDSR